MEQGEHQLFANFLQDFNYRLAQSGGDEAHTALGKTQKLKAAMNNQLRRALIGLKLPPANKHEEWVAEVREIALEVEEMADYRPSGATNTRTRYGAPKSGVAMSVPRNQGVDSEGDIRMGGTNALMAGIRGMTLGNEGRESDLEDLGRPPTTAANAVGHDDRRASLPRAPWRSQQEVRRLLSEGACVRCTERGQFAKECPRFRKRGPLSEVALKGANGISSGIEKVLCSQPLVIVGLINSSFPTEAMVDTGCLCLSVIDENLVRAHKIHIESIPSRALLLADDNKTTVIKQIAKYELDIEGHRVLMWAYVMTNLAYPIILGKPWMEKNQVVYAANRPSLKIGHRELLKRSTENPTLVQRELEGPTGISRQDLIGREQVVWSVSKMELEKALEPKKTMTREETRANLPAELWKFTELFLEDGTDGNDALPPHRPGVDTKVVMQKDNQGRDKEVPWGPLYGMTREELLVLRKTLTELQDKNWIRVSSSPGGAPVLFIKKPGEDLRFCVDYRVLNAVTERDRYPLPLIRETMQMLSGASWLTKVDVRSAFHRLRIAGGDEWKTAFRTRFGSFEWLVTPFCLAGAPSAFQRWINKELGDLLGVTCSAYVDDVVIFTDGDLEDHWTKVSQVLQRLQNAGLKLDPRKCEFAKKEIKYLGFIVNVNEGIKADPEKVRAIGTWEAPKNVKGLTKKGTPFRWGQEQEESFESLKSLFSTAPILALWNGDNPTVLETDASGWATGGCLLQKQPGGQLKPVAYFSKKLSPAECNYDIHDKELLAIIRCLNEWKSELLGVKNPFLILTDHQNLKYFMTSRRLSERQVRWSQLLSQFNFELDFRSGKLAGRPDALSRRAQDIPGSINDPRLKEREFRLLKEDWIHKNPVVGHVQADQSYIRGRIPTGESVRGTGITATLGQVFR
ncbi:hypothetical protein K3495_g13307 [Podosphaera aphanis]|nr:hypothetical protein K3495_g13307 [Podosphaera aphanis]